MHRRTLIALTLFAWVLFVGAPPPPAHAGLMDAVKKKINDKATKQIEQAVGKATEKPAEAAADKAAAPAGSEAAPPGASHTAAGGKVSTVSTKFDFVPGDSVMLLDDFTLDELGEFPARWRLAQGTFEVAESEGERWLRCTSEDGRVRMKLPAKFALPEFWTLEFDFLGSEPMASALTVRGLDPNERTIWEAVYPQGTSMAFATGAINSTTPLDGATTPAGRHHVMFMARGIALKAYIDRQRMVSVPEIEAPDGPPTQLEIRLWGSTQPMITNVRFAEGCRPAKDMLAEGKLVTYGIHFASASDVVLPESAPVLRQIVSYLEAHPNVKLKITGHTDNVGTPASNLDLSKRRSASVARVLSEQFGIAADRLATDGSGDTRVVASNTKPEGRAMNRRVEFERL